MRSENKPLFGKYNQLVMLGLAFILTTLLGSQLQQRNWDKQQSIKIQEEEIDNAKEVYSQVLNHHYDLIATMFKTLDEYESWKKNNPEITEVENRKDWDKYMEMVGQYEADYPKYYFIILSTFGLEARNRYFDIHSNIGWAKEFLKDLYIKQPPLIEIETFRKRFNATNGITGPIAKLNGQMLLAIRAGKVGRFIPEEDQGKADPGEQSAGKSRF